MYGNGWKNNGNGTFTSTAKMSGFSSVDLYLMGMLPKEEVPPMLLIDNPAIDKMQLPQLGATIPGAVQSVTVDDIIAAEGARAPDFTTSQKKFTVGFVLLTRPGENPGAAPVAIETLRTAWAGRFAEMTQGVGGINGVAPSLNVVIDSPADNTTTSGPDVTVTGAVINSTGAETGVTVNGIPATVNGSRFIADHLPLQQGANSITVAAVDANGLSSASTRTIIVQPGNYLRLTSNIESGVAPLEISLQVSGSFIIDNPVLTGSGPAPVTLKPGTSQTEFTTMLTTEGTYTFSGTAVGPDGQTYSDIVTVTVLPRAEIERLLQSRWANMKERIAAIDVDGTLGFIASKPQAKYREFFTALGRQLPLLNEYLKDIEMVYMTGGFAKCRLYRDKTIMGQVHKIEYVVYFVQENGVWKLCQF